MDPDDRWLCTDVHMATTYKQHASDQWCSQGSEMGGAHQHFWVNKRLQVKNMSSGSSWHIDYVSIILPTPPQKNLKSFVQI